jgi:energy-coupling factor transporter ATP-binding protein EcfA2
VSSSNLKEAMDAAPEEVADAADLILPRYAPVLPARRDEFEFVMEPTSGKTFNGWFPRGTVSVIAGSSGSGKSTFMLSMLHKQSQRAYILGHRGAALRYLVLFADRGDLSNRMTLKRMGLDKASVCIDYLGTVLDMDAVQAVWNAVEKFEADELPQAVFIEGMDLMMSEMNKMHIVGPVMRGLQRLATHYHIAVILSLGAPKQNGQNKGATARRDMVIGSSGWGRTAETVCVLTAEGDGTSSRRKFTAQHRNEATETFDLQFENGLLVEAPPDTLGDPLEQFLLTQQGAFTLSDAVEGAKDADIKESRSTIHRRLDKLVKDGVFETVFTDRKQRYKKKEKE